MNNQTRQDAIDRVMLARVGSLAPNDNGQHASVEYLEALRRELLLWLPQIDIELGRTK